MGTIEHLQREARDYLAPTLGLAFFWAFLRYQNFFMLLYPRTMEITAGGLVLPAHAVVLCALLALTVVALAYWRQVTDVVERRRPLVLAACTLGSAGTALALLPSQQAAAWVSAPFVALGFLASLVAWADYLAGGFDGRKLVIIAVSYFVSLVVFQNTGPSPFAEALRFVLTVAVPLGSGIGWFAASRTAAETDGALRPERVSLKRLATPSIWLFAAFLLAGSIIRGIVDIATPASPLRHRLSIVVALLLAALCLAWVAAQSRKGPGGRTGPSTGGRRGVAQFAMACWIAFSSMFFFGIVLLLALGDASIGGSVVVVARSMLGVSYWILLCDLSRRSGVASVPLFLVCEALVETLSWALSYVAVPLVAGSDNAGIASPYLLVTITVCSLAAVVAVICGTLLVAFGGRKDALLREAMPPLEGEPPAEGDAAEGAAASLLVERCGLTPREALVAVRYAHGYSLKKVSDELGVTNSSAQSCIRSVYRKLGIHTKDELIAVIDGL